MSQGKSWGSFINFHFTSRFVSPTFSLAVDCRSLETMSSRVGSNPAVVPTKMLRERNAERDQKHSWAATKMAWHFGGNHLWSISSFRRHWNLGRLCWRRFPLRWMTICGWRDKPDIHQTVPNLHVTACICGNHFSWSCRSCLLLLEAQAGFHHSEECTNVPMLQ